MASAVLPWMKPTQVVKPMKGGIFQPSTDTGKSVRGAVTLNTASAGVSVPFSPVISWMRLVSSLKSAACALRSDARANPRSNPIFMLKYLLQGCTFVNMRCASWLLLLYALPTRQTAERVNVWRKFKKFGAVQLKNSAYLLPDAPPHLERFQWLAKQVRDAGGEATLIQANRIEGYTNDQIAGMFNEERAKDYQTVIEQLK